MKKTRLLLLLLTTLGLTGLLALPTQADEAPPIPEPIQLTALEQCQMFIKEKNIDTTAAGWKTKLPKFKELTYHDGESYTWILDTNKGKITIDLFHDTAPNHVSSTIYLTEVGFYDDLLFHRVIPGFMAQGGCPLGKGFGGPGYKYDGEYKGDHKHDGPGVLSTANTGRPTTDGSQFFLTFVPTPWLDGKHTIFGKVSAGMDVVKTLEKFGSRSGRTSEVIKINKARIEKVAK